MNETAEKVQFCRYCNKLLVDPVDDTAREMCWDCQRSIRCTRCGLVDENKVGDRYSFGVYAGRLCTRCCGSYRDNCGLDRPQGDPDDLDEQYDPDDPSDLM